MTIPDQTREDERENWQYGFLPMDKVRNKTTGAELIVNSANYYKPDGRQMFSACGKHEVLYLQDEFEIVHRCIHRPYSPDVARCECGKIYTTMADTMTPRYKVNLQ